VVTEPARRGRTRDPARDAVILDAALAELAESGYAGMTTDAVAARAGVGTAGLEPEPSDSRWDSGKRYDETIRGVRSVSPTSPSIFNPCFSR
jgi:hypothetical protein